MLEMFRDKFEEIVIITAGPSFKAIDAATLKNFCEGKLVVSIKQTINFLDFSPHIHLLNDCNLVKYNYHQENVLRLMVKSPSWFSYTPDYMYDEIFHIDEDTCRLESSLSFTRDFKKWQDLAHRVCCWGPGIMHELGIYLPVYLNCKKAYFIGWDIGSPSTNVIERFYEQDRLQQSLKRWLINKNLFFYNNFYVRAENLIRLVLFLMKFPVMLNIPGVTENEAALIADSTKELHDFYLSNNLESFIISEQSMVSEKFERFGLK